MPMTDRTIKSGQRDLTFTRHRDFEKSLVELARCGGKFNRAALLIQALMGRITVQDSDPFHGMKLTNHGENRVDKCVKYDLAGGAVRLITIQDSGMVLLCFAGNHSQCDRWLDKNRGSTLIRDNKGQVKLSPIGVVRDEVPLPVDQVKTVTGYLFEQIKPVKYFDKLVETLPRSLVRTIEAWKVWVSDDELLALSEKIESSDVSEAVLDVFTLLKNDEPEKAVERIRLLLGESQPIVKLTSEEIAALAESDQIRKISPDEAYYPEVLAHFARHGGYMDWMLYLHPDQQEIVDKEFNGPAKLIGVSGSGKTCVIVQRAIRLARDTPDAKVLILTLNRQLARLIKDMTMAAALPDIAARIRVSPLFALCQELLHQFEPENDRLYNDVTWKSHEHIDEIWREFYRCELNNNDAEVLLPVHDSLIARGINAEEYIREELDWIRSVFPPDERNGYLRAERTGRSFPLDVRYRKLLLETLIVWEKKMPDIGVTDYLGLSTVLARYKDRIQPDYRYVLVDESQDLGTIEFQLIRQLVSSDSDDLFLCGDAAQRVQTKHGSLRHAGIDVPGARSLKLNKNYRNSREILSVANEVLKSHFTEEMLDSPDFEILDPEHANFSGAAPLMCKADSLEEEIAFAMAYVKDYLDDEAGKKCCISLCGHSLYQVQEYGKRVGIEVLDGNIAINESSVFLSDLEHTKGFEFDLVIVVNCNEGVLPAQQKPDSEKVRDLSRFYVAMTRAKYQLVLSYSDVASSYLDGVTQSDYVLECFWGEYVDGDAIEFQGVPPRLSDIRLAKNQIGGKRSLMDLSGPEFLYTKHAIGLSSSLISNLRTKISKGVTRSVNGRSIPVAWANIRSAAKALEIHPGSRQVFGEVGLREFRALLKKIEKFEQKSGSGGSQ